MVVEIKFCRSLPVFPMCVVAPSINFNALVVNVESGCIGYVYECNLYIYYYYINL